MDSKFDMRRVAELERMLAQMRAGVEPTNRELHSAVNKVIHEQMDAEESDA
jgi:hypothetical protein